MTLRIIGDVHGRTKEYQSLLENVGESIQVGDMGLGFPASQAQRQFFALAH